MVEGFKDVDAKSIVTQVSQGFQDEWNLTDDNLKKLKDLLQSENNQMKEIASLQIRLTEVSNAALKSREERDNFCKYLEKDLNIPAGTNWTVDLDKGKISKKKA